MVLAVFKKTKSTDKSWTLASLAPDMLAAKKSARIIKKNSKKMGYTEAVKTTIQSYTDAWNIPQELADDKIVDEKQLWS
jgi:hypothetical protein